MKKIALFIILFLLFLPVNVFGEEVGLDIFEGGLPKYGVGFKFSYENKLYYCITFKGKNNYATYCYHGISLKRAENLTFKVSVNLAENESGHINGPFYIKIDNSSSMTIKNLDYILQNEPGTTKLKGFIEYPIIKIPYSDCIDPERATDEASNLTATEVVQCYLTPLVETPIYTYLTSNDNEISIYDSQEGFDDGTGGSVSKDLIYSKKQEDLTIGDYKVTVGINKEGKVGYISKAAYGKNVKVESDAIPDRYENPNNYIYYHEEDYYDYTEEIIHKKAICYSYTLSGDVIRIHFKDCRARVSCGYYHFYKKTDIFEKISNSNFTGTYFLWKEEGGYYQLEVEIDNVDRRVVELGEYCPMAIRVNGVENNLIKGNSTLDLIPQGSALANLDYGYYLVHKDLIGEQGKPNDKYSGVEDCGDLDVNRIKVCGCIPAGVADITSRIYFILRIVGPLLLLILGGFEMAKAISTQDESAISKAKKKLVNKFIAAAAIFLTLTVIKFIVGIVADDSQALFECIEILLNGYVI